MAEKEENSSGTKDKPIPFFEWLAAAVGLIMVAGALGFIIYQAASDGEKPPILKVGTTNIEKTEAGYLVRFEIENVGDETAAAVVVEGKLTKAAQEIETSSATFDYAPPNSKRKGGLYFKNDPNQAELEILAKSYQQP